MELMEQKLAALDEMEYLLERMLELAECAAEKECGDARRRELQKGLELLRGLLNEAAQRYHRGRTPE